MFFIINWSLKGSISASLDCLIKRPPHTMIGGLLFYYLQPFYFGANQLEKYWKIYWFGAELTLVIVVTVLEWGSLRVFV